MSDLLDGVKITTNLKTVKHYISRLKQDTQSAKSCDDFKNIVSGIDEEYLNLFVSSTLFNLKDTSLTELSELDKIKIINIFMSQVKLVNGYA